MGAADGRSDGALVGDSEGANDGASVGTGDGSAVGTNDGEFETRFIFLKRCTNPPAFPSKHSISIPSSSISKSAENPQYGDANVPTSLSKKSAVT